MRRIFKILLVIGIGFALAKPKGPDGSDGPPNRSGDGDGPDTPPQKSPSGKINTDQGTESASQAVQAEAEQGRATGTSETSPPEGTNTNGSGWTDSQRNNMSRLGEVNDSRRVHILDGEYDGDGNPVGGGHAPGVGIPGKSEFPERWEDDEIIDNITSVAQNPTSAPDERPNGGWIVQGEVDGVTIEVVMNRDGSVWTAYPTEGEGVVFNPED